MILREADDGLILIRQTEHARVCGVLARAWGNADFASVEPAERVAEAAAEHDNGWREWEDAPTYNPETGRPFTYIDIPIEQHLKIYRRGIARAIDRHPYVGLLVSLHGSLLYSRFRPDQPGTSGFLDEQARIREDLRSRLRRDPELRADTDDTTITTNRDLLFGWDALSLFLCHGRAWMEALAVPHDYVGGRTRLRVEGGDAGWSVSPYPFGSAPLELSIAALRVEAPHFPNEAAMRRGLERAREIRLRLRIQGGQRR